MTNYFVVDPSGYIVNRGSCQAHLLDMHSMGMDLYEGEPGPPEFFYAPGGVITERPRMPLIVTQGPFSITGIPPGTEVSYPGGSTVVDDGFIEWDSVVPGSFEFRLVNFPFVEEIVVAEIT